MIRPLAAVAAPSALLILTASSAAAAGLAPGTPGDPNCVGQTLGYYARNNGFGTTGIGGLVHYQGQTAQDLKAFVVSYCTNTPPPPPPPPVP